MHRGELLSGPSVPKIYVGIRTERSLPGSKDLHTALRAACGEQNFYATSYWPSLRYVPSPTDRWWEDRQAFEQTLVGAAECTGGTRRLRRSKAEEIWEPW